MSLKDYLKSERKAFAGVIHVSLSVLAFELLFVIDSPFVEEYLTAVTSDWRLFVASFVTVLGASVIPDLDNRRSTATLQLGAFGDFVSAAASKFSLFVYKLWHFKRDPNPAYHHRLFFHTPAFLAALWFAFDYYIPEGDQTPYEAVAQALQSGDYWYFTTGAFVATAAAFSSCFVSWWLSMKVLLYRFTKSVAVKTATTAVVTTNLAYFIASNSFDQAKVVVTSYLLGYAFHLAADLFSVSSIPLLWPVPVKYKAYWSPHVLGKFQVPGSSEEAYTLHRLAVITDVLLACAIFQGWF